jgi:cytidine deaminase
MITEAELVEAALAARACAYAPYSNFLVGAALQTAAGQIVMGCNVENASLGLTECAERVALFSAVSSGTRRFTKLALATVGGVAPCGACRQVLSEFCDDLEILLIDVNAPQAWQRCRLHDLLPYRFGPQATHE